LALSLEQGTHLVSVARKAIDIAVSDRRTPESDELPVWRGGSAEFLTVRRGAFVTLKRVDGNLRGCIGIPYPLKPLRDAVVHAAVGAAERDPRFPEVEASELDSLTVEVSALTQPETLDSKPSDLPDHVRVGIDGLIVSGSGTSGLLLPQVASEMNLNSEAFLSLTCRKAGLMPDAWRTKEVRVQRFQAEVFAEATPRGVVGGLLAQL